MMSHLHASGGPRATRRIIVFIVLATLPTPMARGQAAGQLPVPIEIRVTSGDTLAASWPLTVGVPIARQAGLLDASDWVVRDADGAPRPTQVEVVARWNGARDDAAAPIRWLRVSFVTELSGEGHRSFHLGPANDAEPRMADGYRVARPSDSGWTVNTGALALSVPRDGTALIDSVRVDFDRDGQPDLALVDAAGALRLATPESTDADTGSTDVELVANGPVRAAFRVRTEQPNGRVLHAYIEAFRGQDWIRVRVRHNGGESSTPTTLEGRIHTLGDPLFIDALSPSAAAGRHPVARAVNRRTDQFGLIADSAGTVTSTSAAAGVATPGLAGLSLGTPAWHVEVMPDFRRPGTAERVFASGDGHFAVTFGSDAASHTGEVSLRFGVGPTTPFVDPLISPPVVAAVTPDWLATTLALGPFATAWPAIERARPTTPLGFLTRFLSTPEQQAAWPEALRLARSEAARAEDLHALFFLTGGDAYFADLIADHARSADGTAWLLAAWDVGVAPGALDRVELNLRAALVAAFEHGVCNAPAIPAIVASVGRYAWARRTTGHRDGAGESALETVLDEFASCATGGAIAADAFAYGAALTSDPQRRARYLASARQAIGTVGALTWPDAGHAFSWVDAIAQQSAAATGRN